MPGGGWIVHCGPPAPWAATVCTQPPRQPHQPKLQRTDVEEVNLAGPRHVLQWAGGWVEQAGVGLQCLEPTALRHCHGWSQTPSAGLGQRNSAAAARCRMVPLNAQQTPQGGQLHARSCRLQRSSGRAQAQQAQRPHQVARHGVVAHLVRCLAVDEVRGDGCQLLIRADADGVGAGSLQPGRGRGRRGGGGVAAACGRALRRALSIVGCAALAAGGNGTVSPRG